MTDRQDAVVLEDHRLPMTKRARDLLALARIEHDPAIFLEQRVVVVKGRRVLRQRIKQSAERRPGLAVQRVRMRRRDHVGPGLVQLRMDRERRTIEARGHVLGRFDDHAFVTYPDTLIQLFGGRVIDRFSPRRMLLICGAVVCVATVLTGLVGGMASRFALRLALGVGEGFAFPAATRAMATWLPPARWGFAQGITHAAARLGNALAPPLLVGLMALVSWRGAFVVLGLASAVWVILWLVVARESPERHPGMSDEERAELAPAAWQAAIRPPFRGGGSRGGLRPSRPSISATAGRSGCP
jgi:hypothetical protein